MDAHASTQFTLGGDILKVVRGVSNSNPFRSLLYIFTSLRNLFSVGFVTLECILCEKFHVDQARRLGGFEGVRSNPPFDHQKILYTPDNSYCTF